MVLGGPQAMLATRCCPFCRAEDVPLESIRIRQWRHEVW